MWENVRDPVATGSSFATDWLKLGHEVSRPSVARWSEPDAIRATANCPLKKEKRKQTTVTNTYLISPFFPFSDETIDILKQIENSLAGPTTSPANNRQMAKRDIREFPDTRELLELLNTIHQKLLAWSCISLNNFASLKKAGFLSTMRRWNTHFEVTHGGTFYRTVEDSLCSFDSFNEPL